MPRLKERDCAYFTTVRGMCRGCRAIVSARVFFRENEVWQQSLCPKCRTEPALIAADKNWYLANVLRQFPDQSPLKCSHPQKHGCPHDCGPCAWHASPCQLPVFFVTNACNLRCPACFTHNRAGRLFYMDAGELRRTVDWVVESSGAVDLINITGGEPTLHPNILELLACCKRPEIGRITMNSNGVKLAGDFELCRRLADLDVCVILSFHAFDAQTSMRIYGRDLAEITLRAIDNLTRAGARMTLRNVLISGASEHTPGRLLDLMRANDQILSLAIQTMACTGQGGGNFARRKHIPADKAARIVCEAAGGELAFGDFLPHPAAHPLCYLTCFMLKSENRWLPLARLAPKEEIAARMKNSYLLRLENSDQFFKDIVNHLCAQNDAGQLKEIRRLTGKLFPPGANITPFERQRIAESAVRTICIHSHMDEDTFDTSRAMLCPDLVPAAPGRLIPVCTHNLFYRKQDERFYAEPDAGGRP